MNLPHVGEVWAIDGPFWGRYVRIIRVHYLGSVLDAIDAYDVHTGRLCTISQEEIATTFCYRVVGPGKPAPASR